MISRIKLAEAIAEAWNEKGIEYAVVHGLYTYPESIGRDLDIIISPEYIFSAINIAKSVAERMGFNEVLLRWSHWGLFQFILINKEQRVSLPLDLLCTTTVWQSKWITFVDDEVLNSFFNSSYKIGPFKVSSEGSFYKACIRPLLCGDISRFGGEISMPVSIPPEVDRQYLKQTIGGFGEQLLALPSRSELEKSFPSAMKVIQHTWLKQHKWKAAQALFSILYRRGQIFFGMRADLLVIETKEKDVVLSALYDLKKDMKSIFIDLRVVETSPSLLEEYWGRWFSWRKTPISEFVLYVVVKKSTKQPVSNVQVSYSDNTLDIILPEGSDSQEIGSYIYDNVLSFFSQKYSFNERLVKHVR